MDKQSTSSETAVGNLTNGDVKDAKEAVIDADIHEAFKSPKSLVPYLSAPWNRILEQGAWKGFSQPFYYPTSGGGGRADAKPSDGGPAGSDHQLMREQLLDAYGIGHGVLTGYFYPVMLGEMQVEFASAMASAYNDYQVEEWINQDDRLYGSIHVAPQDPQAAAREVDRMGSHPRMVQVMLPVGGVSRAYGDPFYAPIFEAAQRNELVIAMHHTVDVEGAFGMGRYYIERHMLIPQGMMAQIFSLVCGGVFDRFPGLKFSLLEGGFTWLPHVLWRMDREYKSLRQEVPWVEKMPREYMHDRVKLSTQPTEDLTKEEWEKVIELIGSEETLIFSTDYPHFDFDSPMRSLPTGLSADLKRKILHDNAQALYEFK